MTTNLLNLLKFSLPLDHIHRQRGCTVVHEFESLRHLEDLFQPAIAFMPIYSLILSILVSDNWVMFGPSADSDWLRDVSDTQTVKRPPRTLMDTV